MTYLNIAAYKFIQLEELENLRMELKELTQANCLLGTILLSREEGINIMLCGLPKNINAFRKQLHTDEKFSDLQYKESYSDQKTFNKLFVKIKKEIIAFGIDTINPVNQQAPYVKPKELKQWLDEQRDLVLLDTRNDYEIEAGTFTKAIDLKIKNFRHFPKVAKSTINSDLKTKTIVTFCTGGIRCEKAALLLKQYGFENVYQLDGGILNYFRECGDAHYQGECYVFDVRNKIAAEDVK